MVISSISECMYSSPVTSHFVSTSSKKVLPDSHLKLTPQRSIRTTNTCIWPTIQSTRKMTNSSRMKTVSKMTSDTNGPLEHSVGILSKLVLTWTCSGPDRTMSSWRPSFAERTTFRMPWRKMELIELIVLRSLDSIFWLIQIWSHGCLRSIWVLRWLVTHLLIWRLSQIWSPTPSI